MIIDTLARLASEWFVNIAGKKYKRVDRYLWIVLTLLVAAVLAAVYF